MAFKFYKAPLVALNLPVIPFGKQSIRHRKVGNFCRAYTHPDTVAAMEEIKMHARNQLKGFEPYDKAIFMELDAFITPPESWTKRKKADAIAGLVHMDAKPDMSNVTKLVEDALNGIVFCDDKKIVGFTCNKYYAEKPAIELRFYKFYAYDENVGNDHE